MVLSSSEIRGCFFNETPEQAFRKESVKWFIDRIMKANSWEYPEPRKPFSWLDEITGSVTYAPATAWILDAVDYPPGFGTVRFIPYLDELVPQHDYITVTGGDWVWFNEYKWVDAVAEKVEKLYREHLNGGVSCRI